MWSRRDVMGSLPMASITATGQVWQSTLPKSGVKAPPPGLTLAAGGHAIDHDTILSDDVLLQPGAYFVIRADVTLAFRGDLIAMRSAIFFGEGRVDMTGSRLGAAYPEWWGAVTDDPTFDCLPSLQACLSAHPVMLLGPHSYHIAETWKILLSNRRIWGSSPSAQGMQDNTRIVVRGGKSDVIQLGPDAFPGDSALLTGVDMRWIEVARTSPVYPPPVGREAIAAIGIRAQFAIRLTLEDIGAKEHSIGFLFAGVIRSFVRRCEAYRSTPGLSGRNDIFWGFFFDGDAQTGTAGGNASLYMSDCIVSVDKAPQLGDVVGAYLVGRYADCFLRDFESANCARGIVIDGRAQTRNGKTSGNWDLHITHPVLDSCALNGIEILNLSDYAVIDITDCYIATSAAVTAKAAIFVHSSKGLTTFNGGQLLGWGNADTCGMLAQDSEGLGLRGLKIVGFAKPVSMKACSDIDLSIAINNPGEAAAGPAVVLDNCVRVLASPRIKGRSGAFEIGVWVKGSEAAVGSIECSAIDSRCLKNGKAGLVELDGRLGVSAGIYGGCVITGLLV